MVWSRGDHWRWPTSSLKRLAKKQSAPEKSRRSSPRFLLSLSLFKTMEWSILVHFVFSLAVASSRRNKKDLKLIFCQWRRSRDTHTHEKQDRYSLKSIREDENEKRIRAKQVPRAEKICSWSNWMSHRMINSWKSYLVVFFFFFENGNYFLHLSISMIDEAEEKRCRPYLMDGEECFNVRQIWKLETEDNPPVAFIATYCCQALKHLEKDNKWMRGWIGIFSIVLLIIISIINRSCRRTGDAISRNRSFRWEEYAQTCRFLLQ